MSSKKVADPYVGVDKPKAKPKRRTNEDALLAMRDAQKAGMRLEARDEKALAIALFAGIFGPDDIAQNYVEFVMPATNEGHQQAERVERTLRAWRHDGFAPGQVVSLRSGGPAMTVSAVTKSNPKRANYNQAMGYYHGVTVACTWFTDGGDLRTEGFPADVLKLGA